MAKVKFQIRSFGGEVLFEYVSTANTIKKTLEKAVSEGANLCGADLYGANLRGADLRGANLYGADLCGANLCGADLRGADLRGANLCGADLYGANLRGANLRGADLCGANLCGADLYGAKNIDSDLTDYWWHVHHEVLVEQLTEPVRARINYIKKEKPKDEVKLRLKLLKPVLGKIPSTDRGWKTLHTKECGCAYDFKKGTIFTKKNGLEK